PFKTHYLRVTGQAATGYSKHHRYEVRRALASVRTGLLDLTTQAGAFAELYAHLKHTRCLRGVHDFPAGHFSALGRISGFTAFGGWLGDELVCAHIWAHDDTDAVSHLAASSDKGYRYRAAYAVYAASLDHFESVACVNLGGSVGTADGIGDGLAQFKA